MHIQLPGLALLSLLPLAFADIVTLPSGLKFEDTKVVTCARRSRVGDTVFVHYRGTLEDGVQFDESYKRGQPFSFKLGAGRVIKGWDVGMLDMCPGGRRKLTIPSEMGYGSRGAGKLIPPNSVLLFDTEMIEIQGVKLELLDGAAKKPDAKEKEAAGAEGETGAASGWSETGVNQGGKAGGKSEASTSEEKAGHKGDEVSDTQPATGIITDTKDAAPPKDKDGKGAPGGPEGQSNECHLLGPFAIVVQGALGVLALGSLVIKRWREKPRRPLKIWAFDASKQVVGTALLHVANLAMSMLSSADVDPQQKVKSMAASAADDAGSMPNPCSFYLLNLAIDTTLGIPILVILLKILHSLFQRTSLASPPESLKSGHYGSPPHVSWWAKQCFIYFLGLFGMKLFVLFLFGALPWLPWVGDWALRWTEGNESLQIAFVMFLFPLAMNAMQYYIIDAFIMDKDGRQGYESVQSDERRESGEGRPLRHGEEDEDEDKGLVVGREGVDVDEVRSEGSSARRNQSRGR